MSEKATILIADDSQENRELFAAMLCDDYDVVTACNGEEALSVLWQRGGEIKAVLLDVVMPVKDGFEVLASMAQNGLLADIPVLMLLSVGTPSIIRRALESGAHDYLCRPFDGLVVKKRIANAIASKQKGEAVVSDNVAELSYSRSKSSDLMVAVLGHVLEVRNGENSLHVLHINLITRILLKHLCEKTDKYKLSPAEINVIATASALHDMGKVYIPEEILNKPARLTKEEFEIMKTHAALGAELMKSMPFQDEPLLKYAHDIARWHHEKYDGCGYPDNLVGDDIPIWSQVVSLADVYDALTCERVYKKPYPHDVAMAMIYNGECGAFNPLLLECFSECESVIREEIEKFNNHMNEFDPRINQRYTR